ncbi:ATP-dependent DNA ligase [Candidatus Pacearchaeota archaeon]|nr:ATP-dependent DNA ligase [Candidatus Pacearchaeota archaeon]
MLYSELTAVYERLENTSKRLEKTFILAKLFEHAKDEDLHELVYLASGSVFPDYEEKEIGVSSQIIIKAISTSFGVSTGEVEKKWKSIGDLGKVAEQVATIKKQKTLFSMHLTIKKVFENIKKIAEMTGKGAIEKKIALISELLTAAKPLEARYIVRTVLEDMRVGVGSGVMRDAIIWAFFGKQLGIKYDEKNKSVEIHDREKYKQYANAAQQAFDRSNDFAVVIKAAKKSFKHLGDIELEPGIPVKVMLALKVKNLKEGFETVGKPCAIETKYDGFRMMINKTEDGKIKIFTRRLDEVTAQFPEVVEYVKKHVKGKSFILDSEAVGYDPKKFRYRPFQEISQRIKRKYEIQRMMHELPVEVNVFDILYFDGKNLISTPFKERRKILNKIVTESKWKLKLAKQLITADEKDAEKFYHEALKEGEEGIMMKNLTAPYKPGARVGYMLKLKPELNEFDLAIVGAEYGTGKRKGWLSSFILACQDKGKLLEIGKVGTGIKEKEEEGLSFIELTKLLKPLIIREEGKIVHVKPEIIVTITYQEIQKSPTYASGFALRFPRMSRLRPDRSIKDIAFLEEIRKEYSMQGRKRK